MSLSFGGANTDSHSAFDSTIKPLVTNITCHMNSAVDETLRPPSPLPSVPSAGSPKKLAMSRALGAAFLSHQVEQLEKSIIPNEHLNPGPLWKHQDRKGDVSDRRQGFGGSKDKHQSNNGPSKPRHPLKLLPKKTNVAREGNRPQYDVHVRSMKDADLIVVDSSVLVHGLHQVKKWCKEGREEIVIVPLEGWSASPVVRLDTDDSSALNTLDLLKKGTSALAQRARAASRILEAQVGTNSRIRVQRDDAFKPWDHIDFRDTNTDEVGDNKPIAQPLHLSGSPEWVRRMICCARWETDNAAATLSKKEPSENLKVVLAVLSQSSAQAQVGKMTDSNTEITSPVPLPAPGPHSHKYEPRSAGLLVAHWAVKAGIALLEVESSASPSSANRGAEERTKVRGGRHNTLVERPPAVMAMMEAVAQQSKVVRVLPRGEILEP